MSKSADKKAQLIDDIMAYLSLSDFTPIGNKFHHLPMTYFKEVDACILYHEIFPIDIGAFYTATEDDSATKDDSALDEPMDYCCMFPMTGNTSYFDDRTSKYQIMRVRKVSGKEARGRVHRFIPNMFEFSRATVCDNGTFETARIITGKTKEKFIDITFRGVTDSGRPYQLDLNEECKPATFSFMVHQQFLKRYLWRVVIESAIGPSMSFFTNPSGIRELFRWREIPEGRQRRASIRNWVSDHWRTVDNDEQDRAWIKKHLRGKQQFKWDGFTITVHVPKSEIEEAEKLEQRMRG